MGFLHIAVYLSFLLFAAMVIARAIKIATAPIHLRWELYPVPHEKGKAHYGGSYMEEPEWWTKHPKKSHFNELFVMAQEIVLLKGVWEHNRPLWVGSFTFHFALYMYIVNVVLLKLTVLLGYTGAEIAAATSGIPYFIYILIYFLSCGGAIIGLFGAVRLFMQRVADTNLSKYSSPSHYFNILLIGAIYLTVLIWTITDPNFVSNALGFMAGLVTFSAMPELPAAAWWNILLTCFFLIYLPLTHMTHFFTKYFTYHKVRWEDEANLPGSKIPDKIGALLNQPVTWAAPHIGADGKKTWLVIATTNPWEKKDDN